MSTEHEQDLTGNEYFEPLGFKGNSYLVLNKRLNSVFKLTGRLSDFMIAQIAPLAWWRKVAPQTRKNAGLAEAREFFRQMCAERGVYDEEFIKERNMWAAKRAAQPAPVIAASGLPTAFIIEQKGEYVRVKCPYCGDLHVHGGAVLGARVPHCWAHYDDIGDYELVRPESPKKKAA
jgi:hypothetical protein